MLIFKHFIASLLCYEAMMALTIDNKIQLVFFFSEPETWSNFICYLE